MRARSSLALSAIVAIAATLAGVCAARDARADGLSPTESARLASGATVIREQTLERRGHRYVGGITYTVLETNAAELASVFDDVEAYRRVLPLTKSARLVGSDGPDKLVELTHGNALVEAAYTIRVRQTTGEMRFWLDPSRPHGIDDAWGFFRSEPFVLPNGEPRVLLTYGILVDVGPGLDLFEERVRAAMLSVPTLVQRYVADRRRAP